MKQKMKHAGCSTLVLILMCLPILWAFWPSFSGWIETKYAIRAIERFDFSDEINSKRSFGANTFSNECSSQTIKNYYNKAADVLSRKNKNTKTVSWQDQMGYSRVSTVAQTATGYVEVRASTNNDNDSVYIGFVPGHFDKPDAKTLNNHQLPHGLLRCDWGR